MRDWDQLIRFYHTFLKVQGSYIWSAYMEDPQAIEEMLKIPESEWSKSGPPPLFGWSNLIDKLTDLGDQLIAQRAANAKGVKFYPRPRVPAVELRKKRSMNKQEDAIEAARRKSLERRELNN